MSAFDAALARLGEAADVARKVVSLGDRVAGRLGHGAPRWHRWRGFRLRVRALRAEKRNPEGARLLRIRAAMHLAMAAPRGGEREALLELLAGREPLARETPR